MSPRKKVKVNLAENAAGDEQNDEMAKEREETRSPDEKMGENSEGNEAVSEVGEAETAEELLLSPDEIAKLIKEKEEHYERLLRTQADFDNYRKRVQKEQASLLRYGAENALIEILPVVDNIERAVSAARTQEKSTSQLHEGVELILSQFLDVLKKLGVTPIETVGHPFDPNKHDALLRVHAPDAPDGTVVEEVRKGYCLHDKVLRPAQVTVGTTEPVQEPGDASEGVK